MAEANIANNLFGGLGDDEQASGLEQINLNSEKDYKEFGKKVATKLHGGKAPYRIENFYKELTKDLGKHLDSK